MSRDMNAVEAAEQLTEIGRRLQALERQTRAPAAAMAVGNAWQQLLVDPASALADLLALRSVQPPAARSSTPAHSAAPFDWQMEPTAPQPGTHAQESTLTSAAAFTQPPAPDIQGVRLTRDRGSLRSILNANVRHDERPGAPVEPGADGPHSVNELDWIGSRSGSVPVTRRVEGALTGAADRIPGNAAERLEITRPADQRTWVHASDEMVGQLPETDPVVPDLDAPGRETVSSSVRRTLEPSGEAREFDSEPVDSSLRLPSDTGAARTALDEGHSAGIPRADVTGTSRPRPMKPMPGPDATAWPVALDRPADRTEWPQAAADPQPLNDAQIEQVLDALDERLALLLLRTYGI